MKKATGGCARKQNDKISGFLVVPLHHQHVTPRVCKNYRQLAKQNYKAINFDLDKPDKNNWKKIRYKLQLGNLH